MLFEPSSPAPIGLADESPSARHVLIVDDDAAVRLGLTRLVRQAIPGAVRVEAVASLPEARCALSRATPDLLLLDLNLAGTDGLTLVPDLPTQTRFIVISSFGDAVTRLRVLAAGALAFVDKSAPAAGLVRLLISTNTPHVQGELPTSAFLASSGSLNRL